MATPLDYAIDTPCRQLSAATPLIRRCYADIRRAAFDIGQILRQLPPPASA